MSLSNQSCCYKHDSVHFASQEPIAVVAMNSPVAVRRLALVPEEALGLKILADGDGMPAHVSRGLGDVHPRGFDVLSHASALYGHLTTAAELSMSWCFLGLDTSLRSAESPSSHCDLLGVPWREGR